MGQPGLQKYDSQLNQGKKLIKWFAIAPLFGSLVGVFFLRLGHNDYALEIGAILFFAEFIILAFLIKKMENNGLSILGSVILFTVCMAVFFWAWVSAIFQNFS